MENRRYLMAIRNLFSIYKTKTPSRACMSQAHKSTMSKKTSDINFKWR